MTLRYAHLSPGHKKRAVDLLDRQMDGQAGRNEKKFVPSVSPENKVKKIKKLHIMQSFDI